MMGGLSLESGEASLESSLWVIGLEMSLASRWTGAFASGRGEMNSFILLQLFIFPEPKKYQRNTHRFKSVLWRNPAAHRYSNPSPPYLKIEIKFPSN